MKDLENHKTFKVIWTEIFCKYSNDLNLFPKERFHQQHIQWMCRSSQKETIFLDALISTCTLHFLSHFNEFFVGV